MPADGYGSMKQIICRDLSTWTQTALQIVVRQAHQAIAERGRFRLALSGGKTPIPLFRRLADRGSLASIDWSCCDIFWTDERCVPPTDEASNYGAAWSECLSLLPIPPASIHRIAGEQTPFLAATRYEQDLREHLSETTPLDLVLLGVGRDGHTASLFPGSASLEEDARWAVPVCAPVDPSPRVTLTLPILNAARRILFLVRGRDKREILRRLSTDRSLPASRIEPRSGELIWLLDREASP